MTSKEALESWFNVISTNDKIRWEEHYKVIKKDLEVLEILKKCHNKDSLLKTLINIYNDYKSFNKIKDWLDNE